MRIFLKIVSAWTVIALVMSVYFLSINYGVRALYIAILIIGVFDFVLIYLLYRKYTLEQFREFDFEIELLSETYHCNFCNQKREISLEDAYRMVFYNEHSETIIVKTAYCTVCNYAVHIPKLAEETARQVKLAEIELENKYGKHKNSP